MSPEGTGSLYPIMHEFKPKIAYAGLSRLHFTGGDEMECEMEYECLISIEMIVRVFFYLKIYIKLKRIYS